jgi:LacI family transcriptional regulator
VSIGTVDRVIHRRGRVSRETENKIRRILEEVGYRPNIFAKNLKLSKTFTFGVLMPEPFQDSSYWTLPVRGITRAQSELSSQKVRVRYFFYDKFYEPSFDKVSQNVLSAGLNGLLIAPVLSNVFDRFIREVPEDLPYVFFDSFIPDANYISYIGQDSFQSGSLSAKLMTMLIKDRGQVAVIKMLPEDYHINDRVSGFLFYCKNRPEIIARVYEIDSHKSQALRYKIYQRILSELDDLKGIFVTNASTHQVAEFLQARKRAEKIRVIGYDLIEDNVKYLRRGVIDFLISQQSEKQGYEGILSLYRHVVLGEAVEKKTMMQLDIVTSENIDYYQS